MFDDGDISILSRFYHLSTANLRKSITLWFIYNTKCPSWGACFDFFSSLRNDKLQTIRKVQWTKLQSINFYYVSALGQKLCLIMNSKSVAELLKHFVISSKWPNKKETK